MSQGPTNPTPNLVEALSHHQMSQTLTLRLFYVLQQCPPDATNPALGALIAPLRAALTFTGTPDQALAKQLEALEAGSTPENILRQLAQLDQPIPGLEQALRQYEATLTEVGDLSELVRTHEMAQELAQSHPYHFEVDPEIRSGKPCIKGLRISVYDVLEYLAAGMTADEIVDDFPDLNKEEIHKCHTYAADLVKRSKHPGPG